MPLEFRQGGILLATPKDTLSAQTLADGQPGSEEVLFGPNSIFVSDLLDEAEDLSYTRLVVHGICRTSLDNWGNRCSGSRWWPHQIQRLWL